MGDELTGYFVRVGWGLCLGCQVGICNLLSIAYCGISCNFGRIGCIGG